MRPCLGDLEAGRSVLSSLQAASTDAWLRDLVRPVALCGARSSLPALATLPLSTQANLLLLLRAAPHRFTGAQRAALLEGLAQLPAASGEDGDGGWGQQASLLRLLAAEIGGDQAAAAPLAAPAVPPCPDFLYTSQPCFPWTPVLVDPATAAALHKQQAAARQQQQQGQAGPGVRQQESLAQPAAAGGKRAHGEERDGDAGPAKQQRVGMSAAATAAAAAQLPTAAVEPDADLAAAAQAVRAALGSAAAAGGGAALAEALPRLRDALDALMACAAAGGPEGTAAWEAAGLDSITDDSLLLMLLSELVTPSSSFARCSAAAAGLLLPRLRALEAPAPRDLAAAVSHIGTSNPQAYIAACLRPLLSGPGLSKHLAELLTSTLKSALPPQLLAEVLAAACAPAAATPAAVAGGTAWNEHTVTVLQAVLNAKPALSAPVVAQLAAAAAAAVLVPAGGAELAASPKFAKLLLSVAKQHPAESAAAKVQLQAAAQHTKSFMTKPLLAALAKL